MHDCSNKIKYSTYVKLNFLVTDVLSLTLRSPQLKTPTYTGVGDSVYRRGRANALCHRKKVSNFYDTMHSLNLILLITVPTRLTIESRTLIDTILVSKSYNHTSGVLTFDFSDHFPVFSISK